MPSTRGAEPSPESPGEPGPNLEALGKLPWEDLPEVGATRRNLAGGLGVEDLEQVMAEDALLDLRTMAQAVARSSSHGAPPPGNEPARHPGSEQTGASSGLTRRSSPTGRDDRHEISPAGPGPAERPFTRTRPETDLAGPMESPPEPDIRVDIIEELAALQGGTDTVAVRIQKMIHAHEVPDAAKRPAADFIELTDWLHQDSPDPPSVPATRKTGRMQESGEPYVDDDIDLAALDMDTVAGVESADPDELLHRLNDSPQTASPAPGGHGTHITTGAGVRRSAVTPARPDPGRSRTGVSSIPGHLTGSIPGHLTGSIPGHLTGSIPGHLTGSIPGPLTGSFPGHLTGSIPGHLTGSLARGIPPEEEDDATQPPLRGGQGAAPEAVDQDQAAAFVVERGFVEKRDTVPGRRTAILHGVKPVHDSIQDEWALDEAPRADVTQPESPVSRRTRPARVKKGDGPQGPSDAPRRAPINTPFSPVLRPTPAILTDGRLEALDPARLIWEIGRHFLSGTLRVEAPEGTIDVVFGDGSVRFATSTRPRDRMLAVLTRSGQISTSQASEVEEEILRTGRRAGAILLDRGWIKSAELIPTIREHLEHVVMELFALETGSFRFMAELPTEDEIVHIDRSPAALVIEGVRKKYLPERVMRLVGASEVTPIKLPELDESLLGECPLSGKDWRLIDAMDGRHTVTELSEKLDTSAHHLWALCWSLRCLGLVSLPASGSASHGSHGGTGDAPSWEVEIRRILLRCELAGDGDYFALLGLGPGATPAEIEAAYHRIMCDLGSPPLPVALAERYATDIAELRAVLVEAAQVLLDDRLRERYRRHLPAAGAKADLF